MQRRLLVAAGFPVLLFVSIAALYLIRTPAWDNNDEADHVRYVEHIVATGRPPAIGVSNGVESHQPPLYYAVVAAWQRVAGVPVITPSLVAADPAAHDTGGWVLSHDYNESQRQAAFDLRVLRVPSLVFGALTVLAAFAAAQLMFAQRSLSMAIATLVAVWPKFDAVSAAVTNDILGDAVCAWLFVLVLMWQRAKNRHRSVWLSVGIGVLCAAAALTKYTTLPVVGVLGGYFLAVSILRQRWGSALVASASAAMLSGWWFIVEWVKYGDPLAARATTAYLRVAIPALLWPSGTFDLRTLLAYPLHQFVDSIWWDGDWNQLLLPHRLNLLLGTLAAVFIALSLSRRRAIKREYGGDGGGPVPFGFLALGAAAAFLSLVLIATQTTQFEGRYLFVGVIPLAVLLVIGLRSLLGGHARLQLAATWTWPAILVAVNAYVIEHYLLVHGGL